MIFVYPSVVSENVKVSLIPPVCKALEQFYLAHILESLTTGNLRIKSVFNPSKKVYGPLLLENKKSFGSNVILESLGYSQGNRVDQIRGWVRATTKFDDSVKDETQIEILKKIRDNEEEIRTGNTYSTDLASYESQLQSEKEEHERNHTTGSSDYDSTIEDLEGVQNLRKELAAKLITLSQNIKAYRDVLQNRKDLKGDVVGANKEEREQEKHDKEIEIQKIKKAQVHGSYQVKDVPGVSFKPTMANIKVKVQYIGGPTAVGTTGVGETGDYLEIAVGVKILPMRVINFLRLETAILDDFFARSFDMAVKSRYRSFIRKSAAFISKVSKKIFGKEVDVISKFVKDPIKRTIIYSPPGFVNASSFKRISNTPSFYNYSSALVIINKDDITYEHGQNFFEDRQQMKKLFKMGWNSFCILDDLNETAMFISVLDGGYLHTIPYSYIFHGAGMEKIYDGVNDLNKRAFPMRRRVGNMQSLISRLNRRKGLRESIKKLNNE